jgi:hypothetical protein
MSSKNSGTPQIKSPGTGKGPSQSASPRAKREGNTDPYYNAHRGTNSHHPPKAR